MDIVTRFVPQGSFSVEEEEELDSKTKLTKELVEQKLAEAQERLE